MDQLLAKFFRIMEQETEFLNVELELAKRLPSTDLPEIERDNWRRLNPHPPASD